MRRIIFHELESGRNPVEEFLDSLDSSQAQKVAWTLQLVEELDRVPTQYFKKLAGTDEIWEVRVQTGGNIFRLLGFLDGVSLIILNHAFQKKTQKTPVREIRVAEQRKREYLARKNHE